MPHRAPRPAREILAYFLRNPSAADSLEGIARWRLLEEAIQRKLIETQKALEWLLQEGYVIEQNRPAMGSLFRLNPDRQSEAELLLERKPEGRRRKGKDQ